MGCQKRSTGPLGPGKQPWLLSCLRAAGPRCLSYPAGPASRWARLQVGGSTNAASVYATPMRTLGGIFVGTKTMRRKSHASQLGAIRIFRRTDVGWGCMLQANVEQPAGSSTLGVQPTAAHSLGVQGPLIPGPLDGAPTPVLEGSLSVQDTPNNASPRFILAGGTPTLR